MYVVTQSSHTHLFPLLVRPLARQRAQQRLHHAGRWVRSGEQQYAQLSDCVVGDGGATAAETRLHSCHRIYRRRT